MKKTISIIAAFMLVFAFAGMASAEIDTCEIDPGNINRGCESGIEGQYGQPCATSPFDYEDFGECADDSFLNSYCAGGDKGDIHRALFKICDCIDEGIFDDVLEDEIFDIGMKILIDKDGDGDPESSVNNGVYWAQDVNVTGVGIQSFKPGAGCDEESCTPDSLFDGEYTYILADGTTTDAAPYTGTDCDVEDDQEIVEFIATLEQIGTHGYTVTDIDAISNNSVWWIDIPELRIDSGIAEAGWDIYVEMCIYETLDQGGVCGNCEGCCYTVKIGTICCETGPAAGCTDTLVFPYFPSVDGDWWFGLSVANLGSEDGTAMLTWYESDGTVATASLDVDANTNNADIVWVLDDSSTEGTIGNAGGYVQAVTDFPASGFAMMANGETGASMGYLAEKCGNCGGCY